MKVLFSTFVVGDSKAMPSNRDQIIAILLSETSRLGLDKVKALVEMVKMAYDPGKK